MPPQTYQEALEPGLLPNAPDREYSPDIYRGNNSDLSALIAAVIGLTALVSCFGGVYCLPLVVILLAGSAYLSADTAVDDRRTRRLALLALGVVGLMFLVLLAFILFYVAFLIILMFASQNP